MSALGHKRTFAVHKLMSALPPIADIRSAKTNVRFVPEAEIVVAELILAGLIDPLVPVCSIFQIGRNA
jgi:hypothetical protein